MRVAFAGLSAALLLVAPPALAGEPPPAGDVPAETGGDSEEPDDEPEPAAEPAETPKKAEKEGQPPAEKKPAEAAPPEEKPAGDGDPFLDDAKDDGEDPFGETSEGDGDGDNPFGEEGGRDDDALFSGEPTDLEKEIEGTETLLDKFTIGGLIYVRASATYFEDQALQFSNPNLVDIYMDARPDPRVRAFVSGRLQFDPTLLEGQPSLFSGLSVAGVEGEQEATKVLLDQLWIKTDIARRVYITAGKQRIKWGASRVWNPTDFVNSRQRNPLAFFDDRTGVTMLKVHVPIESLGWNAYALAIFEGANLIEKIGGAGRLEFVFGPAELTLSALGGKGLNTSLGADISAGIWDFDVKAEVAVVNHRNESRCEGLLAIDVDLTSGELESLGCTDSRELDNWYTQVSAGIDYAFKYNDEDIMVLGLEYFFNSLGYDTTTSYSGLFATGQYRPFYTGKHYGAFVMSLPGPGRLDDLTFTLSNLANFSDLSFVTRFDFSATVHTRLRVEAFVMGFYGEPGEFTLGFPTLVGSLNGATQDPPLDPSTIPGLEAFQIPRLMLQFGVNLRVSI